MNRQPRSQVHAVNTATRDQTVAWHSPEMGDNENGCYSKEKEENGEETSTVVA